MLSRLSLTAYGGIGVITPTDGEAILIMAGVDTHLITVTVAGPMAGAVSTVAGVGDGDIITIIINRIIIGMRQEDVLPMQAIIEEVVGEAVVRPIVPVRVIAITDPLLR